MSRIFGTHYNYNIFYIFFIFILLIIKYELIINSISIAMLGNLIGAIIASIVPHVVIGTP